MNDRTAAEGAASPLPALRDMAPEEVPVALAALHATTPVGAEVALSVFTGHAPGGRAHPQSPAWPLERLLDVVVGAGFAVVTCDRTPTDPATGRPVVVVTARRERTLADHVGPGMRLLMCGLNPSIYSADRGVNFARPGNRFWPALLGAGLTTVDRDPRQLLAHDRIGMTDLVKRATVGAAELDAGEYAAGVARLERLCSWLEPGALYLVGLAGWRAAVDRKATAGWQPERLGGVDVYLAPSTSGLNASTQIDGHVAHLRAAAARA